MVSDLASTDYEICVSLDLETTGLVAETDEIIEVGAVRFQGDRVLDTFQVLVNPYRPLPQFIRELTGISQAEVDAGSPFAAVAPQLESFIGDCPIVGLLTRQPEGPASSSSQVPRAPRPTRSRLKPGHGVTTLAHLRHREEVRTMTGTDLMLTSIPGGHARVAEAAASVGSPPPCDAAP